MPNGGRTRRTNRRAQRRGMRKLQASPVRQDRRQGEGTGGSGHSKEGRGIWTRVPGGGRALLCRTYNWSSRSSCPTPFSRPSAPHVRLCARVGTPTPLHALGERPAPLWLSLPSASRWVAAEAAADAPAEILSSASSPPVAPFDYCQMRPFYGAGVAVGQVYAHSALFVGVGAGVPVGVPVGVGAGVGVGLYGTHRPEVGQALLHPLGLRHVLGELKTIGR